MTDLGADPSVKVVVFQSANPDFFIAHLDVFKAAERPEALGLWREFVLRLASSAVVSIAKIRGCMRGIGNEFMLARDMRFAGRQNALFGNPEVGVGLVPGGGALEWLPCLVGRSRALEFVLSAYDFKHGSHRAAFYRVRFPGRPARTGPVSRPNALGAC